MEDIHFFRVFTDAKGNFGDVASVVLDEGRHISESERLAITRKLGTGETAFVNNIAEANISIMHYQGEVSFAGTVSLCTSLLISILLGKQIKVMHSRDREIITWDEKGLTWVSTNLSTLPPWHLKQLKSAEAVEQIVMKDTLDMEHTMVWAWADKTNGQIRARTFASDWEIPEAQGNGSGSMMLAAYLKRDIKIKHGEGSVIFAKTEDNDRAAIGGWVIEDNSVKALGSPI